MIQKKVVLLGAPGVGKTSLVRRYVQSLFDDRYLTTIGVKVDKKTLRVGDVDLQLMLWDVAGAEEQFSVPASYVRGAAGCLIVVDGTRPETIGTSTDLLSQLARDVGTMPRVVVLNKADLVDAWQVSDGAVGDLTAGGHHSLRASAKTGEGVEAAFSALARRLV